MGDVDIDITDTAIATAQATVMGRNGDTDVNGDLNGVEARNGDESDPNLSTFASENCLLLEASTSLPLPDENMNEVVNNSHQTQQSNPQQTNSPRQDQDQKQGQAHLELELSPMTTAVGNEFTVTPGLPPAKQKAPETFIQSTHPTAASYPTRTFPEGDSYFAKPFLGPQNIIPGTDVGSGPPLKQSYTPPYGTQDLSSLLPIQQHQPHQNSHQQKQKDPVLATFEPKAKPKPGLASLQDIIVGPRSPPQPLPKSKASKSSKSAGANNGTGSTGGGGSGSGSAWVTLGSTSATGTGGQQNQSGGNINSSPTNTFQQDAHANTHTHRILTHSHPSTSAPYTEQTHAIPEIPKFPPAYQISPLQLGLSGAPAGASEGTGNGLSDISLNATSSLGTVGQTSNLIFIPEEVSSEQDRARQAEQGRRPSQQFLYSGGGGSGMGAGLSMRQPESSMMWKMGQIPKATRSWDNAPHVFNATPLPSSVMTLQQGQSYYQPSPSDKGVKHQKNQNSIDNTSVGPSSGEEKNPIPPNLEPQIALATPTLQPPPPPSQLPPTETSAPASASTTTNDTTNVPFDIDTRLNTLHKSYQTLLTQFHVTHALERGVWEQEREVLQAQNGALKKRVNELEVSMRVANNPREKEIMRDGRRVPTGLTPPALYDAMIKSLEGMRIRAGTNMTNPGSGGDSRYGGGTGGMGRISNWGEPIETIDTMGIGLSYPRPPTREEVCRPTKTITSATTTSSITGYQSQDQPSAQSQTQSLIPLSPISPVSPMTGIQNSLTSTSKLTTQFSPLTFSPDRKSTTLSNISNKSVRGSTVPSTKDLPTPGAGSNNPSNLLLQIPNTDPASSLDPAHNPSVISPIPLHLPFHMKDSITIPEEVEDPSEIDVTSFSSSPQTSVKNPKNLSITTSPETKSTITSQTKPLPKDQDSDSDSGGDIKLILKKNTRNFGRGFGETFSSGGFGGDGCGSTTRSSWFGGGGGNFGNGNWGFGLDSNIGKKDIADVGGEFGFGGEWK